MTGTLRERLIALIEPLLQRLGYELVDLEYSAGRAHAGLRLFIDREAGVTLDDCAQVSREVSTLLDVEDPIPSAYTLEVSSPGFDRVLRTQAHFGRFVGSRVFVELKEPRAGRRRYTGKLLTVETRDDRTLFFDMLPVFFQSKAGYKVKVKLFTVPGQVLHNATRRVVLQNADAVAQDSRPPRSGRSCLRVRTRGISW